MVTIEFFQKAAISPGKRKFIIFYCLILLAIPIGLKAQLPVAPNGKFLEVKGVKLYFEETGSGKPLLLLHGFGRTADEWKPFVSEYAKMFRVIAIDLPGHGRSDLMDSSDNYLHKKAAEYIISFCTALKLDSIQILGFSSGAIISLHIAIMKPDLLNKMILVAGQQYFSDSTRSFIRALGSPENFIMDPEELKLLHGPEKGKSVAEQFWNFQTLTGDPSFAPEDLKTIKVHTFIIHGDNDPIALVENAFQFFRHIPGAHLWILPNAEHIGFFFPPYSNEFLDKTLIFLNKN